MRIRNRHGFTEELIDLRTQIALLCSGERAARALHGDRPRALNDRGQIRKRAIGRGELTGCVLNVRRERLLLRDRRTQAEIACDLTRIVGGLVELDPARHLGPDIRVLRTEIVDLCDLLVVER